MFSNFKHYLKNKVFAYRAIDNTEYIKLQNQVGISLARVAAACNTRRFYEKNPNTWEFSGFSQNGEDGIVDYLMSHIVNPNRYFIEIGASNGIENNTAYLAHVKKYHGLMVEGDKSEFEKLLQVKPWLVDAANIFVDLNNLNKLDALVLHKNPDFFSIDIDGNDYYIVEALLKKGYLPKVIAVEYNSAFGPDAAMTIAYNPSFNMYATDYPFLYYGVSIAAWKKLLSCYDYRFLSVEKNGVNAFFVNPLEFQSEFLEGLAGLDFAENVHQSRQFKVTWKKQFEKIRDLELHSI